MIIALGTRKQVGKDTVGNYLVEHYGFKRLAFADMLKKEVQSMLSWQGLSYDPSDEQNKEKYRPLLIAYSELCRSLDANYWLNPIIGELYDKKEKHKNWVITDMRYPNEANALRALGGIIVRINRKTGLPDEPTEKVGDEIKADYVLENNESIEDLYQKVEGLAKVLSLKSPK